MRVRCWRWGGVVLSGLAVAAAGRTQDAVLREVALPPLQGATWARGEPFAWGDEGLAAVLLVGPRPDSAPYATLADAAAHLDELQGRHAAAGLRVLALPERGAGPVPGGVFAAVRAPRLAAAVAEFGGTATLVDGDGRLLWFGALSSGVSYLVERALAGERLPFALIQDQGRRLEALGEIEDHATAELRKNGAAMVARNPRNPDGWLLQVIAAAERDVDLPAARRLAARAFKEMALDGPAVGRFADKLLRTVPDDADLLQQCLMALVPVVAMAPDDLPLQFTYLEVLSGVGRQREAERLVTRLREAVASRPAAAGAFAEALAFGKLAPVFAPVALRAVGTLRETRSDAEALLIEYLVQRRCAGDADAAGAVLDAIVRMHGGDAGLNNATWYLMTREPGRGRFNIVALELARRMLAAGDIDAAEQDTVALALFLNGLHDEAIELQEAAAQASGQESYRRRLARYRRAAALEAVARRR